MKRKAAVRYLLHSYRNPLLIFYGIILLVSLLVCTLMEVQVAGEGKVSSVNGASVIFLFVCGLNAFKEDFCAAHLKKRQKNPQKPLVQYL